nr:MAG TPA: hypothetical protein [Caudoviricetes sp.]
MTENVRKLFFWLLRRLCFWRKSRGKTWVFRFPHTPQTTWGFTPRPRLKTGNLQKIKNSWYLFAI